MTFIRSSLFLLYASIITVIVGTLVVIIAPTIGPLWGYRLVWLWRRGFMGGVHWILGIRTELRGMENMPDEPAVILSKHQSAWETVALQDLRPRGKYCVFVLKKELLSLPFFGWSLRAMQMISIDRTAGKDALDQVVDQGRDCLQRGFSVIVFPEGTRVPPGQKKRYKIGGAYLATHVGCKVVPVAHNAGELWPRNAFLRKAGTVVMSVGPAIDATGKNEAELNAEVEAWIEGEMRRLSPHRYPDAQQAA